MTCSQTSPCATFQQAHDATTAGGEINCVDAGDYQNVAINRAISIVCDNTEAAILATGGLIGNTGVSIAAGPTEIVTLKGLDIDGGGTGHTGILFISGAALHVHKVQVRNFRQNASGVAGITFEPSAFAELYVADSYITDNGGSGVLFGGIVIAPTGSGSANAIISRTRVENNAIGISVNGAASTGVAVNAVIVDSVVSGSGNNGIEGVTSAGNAAVSVFVDHCVVSGNFANGVIASGNSASGPGSAVVRIGDSTITLNVTGVAAGGGAGLVQSFKNNRISSNLTDGTPIPAFPGPGGTPLQ